MAAGDSQMSISNSALLAIGADLITSLDDRSKPAIVCKAQWDQTRQQLLASHPWRFALKQAQLSASTSAPLFGYGAAYPLPNDCLRVYDMPLNPTDPWEVFGPNLLTDAGAPAQIVYVADIEDCTAYPPWFVAAFVTSLAQAISVSVSNDAAKVATVNRALPGALRDAKTADSQQGSNRELDADVWLRARA